MCVCAPLYKEGFQGCKQVHKRLNHPLFQAPGLKRLEQTARCDKLSKVRKANSVEVMAQEISVCLPIEKMSPDKMSPGFLRVLRVLLSSACLTSSSLPPSGVTFFFRVYLRCKIDIIVYTKTNNKRSASRRNAVFKHSHSRTWFQKCAVSGSENTGSINTQSRKGILCFCLQ